MDADRTSTRLIALGFVPAAIWVSNAGQLSYELKPIETVDSNVLFDVANALYAFCDGEKVLYVGKTARSLRKRMGGYCRPGRSQVTNWRCNESIQKALENGRTIDIYAFTPTSLLQYGGFDINLAAGLEDTLILAFNPPWNGGGRGQAVSETVELETNEASDGAELPVSGSNDLEPRPPIGEFKIRLGRTYYEKGIVNPRTKVSHLFGADHEPIIVRFSDGSPAISRKIDRRANQGAVRLVGNNQAMASWFQTHFGLDDLVTARILSPNDVEFLVD